MMKHNDNKIFYIILLISGIIGFVIPPNFFVGNRNSEIIYSDLITFLSITMGFVITSLSILFNSPILLHLSDREHKSYPSQLHSLKAAFERSIFTNLFSIILIILMPNDIYIHLYKLGFLINKNSFILPIVSINIFCFYKIIDTILYIFSFPRNIQ